MNVNDKLSDDRPANLQNRKSVTIRLKISNFLCGAMNLKRMASGRMRT